MTLAEKILSLRMEKGFSQEDLAEQMEVSRQSVSKWETAQSVPDLDRLIRLADLFGVTVDELVRDGELPQTPEPAETRPPEPQVIYVERKQELTPVQMIGVVLEVSGAALAVIGLMGAPLLTFAALALVITGLPLLLAKKHPWLIMGWLAVALSCVILNPHTSICPWGLAGGLQRLYLYIKVPGIRHGATVLAIAVGMIRGLVTLALLYFTWKAGKRRGEDS